MQKHVNLVDLVKSFPTNIFLQNLASIQPRTSPMKFAHFAEKSEKGSTSNLSTKAKKDHGKKLKDMNETTKEMRDEMWKETGESKAAQLAMKENYTGEGKLIAEMEDDLKLQSENVTNLKIKFGDLQEELGCS